MAVVICEDYLPDAPDIVCPTDNASLITAFDIALPGNPIVLPAKLTPEETAESQLSRELIRRRALTTGNDRIVHVKVDRGQMPIPTPSYKTNPNTGGKILDETATALQYTGTDYKDNDENYDWWKSITEANQSYLVYANVGRHLLGGLKGVLATINAAPGIIDDANISHRINWTVDWFGSPFTPRLKLAI